MQALYSARLPKQSQSQLVPINNSNCFKKHIVIPKNIFHDKETLYENLLAEKIKNRSLQRQYKQICSDSIHQKSVSKQSPAFRTIIDENLSDENTALKQQVYELKQQLSKYQIFSQHDFDRDCLFQDNIELVKQIELLNSELTNLRKIQSDYIIKNAELRKLKKVVKKMDVELDQYRIRDPFSDYNKNMKIKNEIQLTQELQEKSDEIISLQTSIQMLKKNLTEEQKEYFANVQELNMRISALNYENHTFRDRIQELQKENQVLQEKSKMIDRYMNSNKKKSMIVPEDELPVSSLQLISHSSNLIQDEQIVKCVQKYQIDKQARDLKFHLRSQNVSLEQAEQIIFGNKKTINLVQIQQAIAMSPFDLQSTNLFARYLVEDNSKEEYAYNPEDLISTALARSVFRTLLNNYKLLKDNNIMIQFKQALPQIKEFMERKALQICTFQYLQESFQSFDSLMNIHLDYFQQLYYEKFNESEQFELTKLQYFEQTDFNFQS